MINSARVDHLKAAMQANEAESAALEAEFLRRYPAYATTRALDSLRATEFSRLDGHTYLDYTGGGLYAASQIEQHSDLLLNGVFGNPHSSNPTSLAATELDHSARKAVLNFFQADPDEYEIIFTANASGALKLVGESYPFEDNGQYLLTFDNHNSVNGIREFAYHNGARVTYSPLVLPELRIDEAALNAFLDAAIPGGNNLFAYPAQSNFSGVQHSLDWIGIAQAKGWDVLLDGAAFTPTSPLDLSAYHPDFVSLSFYKIFGYPTGVGALLARREALSKLRRPWFAGGTIEIASASVNTFVLAEGASAFEDGTVNYLCLPAVEIGLKQIESVGLSLIHERVACLTGYLLEELQALHHDNGAPLVTIYGPLDMDRRGGTIALNLYDPAHVIFDYRQIEALANEVGISLRTGCFCNPGADESAHQLTAADIEASLTYMDRVTFERFQEVMAQSGEHDAVGAVRVSLGQVSNVGDVQRFLRFARSFLNTESEGFGASAR